MELFGSNIKKALYFLKKKLFLYFRKRKNSLYFGKWNFLALILKNFRKRKPRKNFIIFQETGTLKKLLIFWEVELFSVHPEKISYTSGNGDFERILYISGNGTFLYFRKGIFGTLAYLELGPYREP